MKLTLEELRFLYSAIRYADPTANQEPSQKEEQKLFDKYEKLIEKLAAEIQRQESKNVLLS